VSRRGRLGFYKEGEPPFGQAWAAWEQRWQALLCDPERTVGAIRLCHLGCGYRQWLVVSAPSAASSGPTTGRTTGICNPFRRRDGQQVSCSRWSLGWLHQAAARLGRP
jgi:hypothetical protein